MPKYINNNAVEVVIGVYRISPGQTIETLEFLENLPSGVVKTAEAPFYNPILVDADYPAGASTIDVPSSPTKAYWIDIFAETDDTTVKFNDAAFSPVILVLQGTTYRRYYAYRAVNSIILAVAAGGSCHIRIEQG